MALDWREWDRSGHGHFPMIEKKEDQQNVPVIVLNPLFLRKESPSIQGNFFNPLFKKCLT